MMSDIDTQTSLEYKSNHSTISGRHGAKTEEEVQLLGRIGRSLNAIMHYKLYQTDQSAVAHEDVKTCGGGCRRGRPRSVRRNGRGREERQSFAPPTSLDALSHANASVLHSGQ